MSRHARIFTLAILLLFVPAATSWADTQAKKLEPPQVKLLDRGKGKRQKLRYQVEAGAKEQLQMDMDIAMKMSMGGQSLADTRMPTTRMRMEFDVTEVTKEGHIRYGFRYTGVELLDTPGVQPAVRTAMAEAMKGMDSMSGHVLVTDRGLVLEGGFETGSLANPQIQQLLASLEQSIQQMSAPLPAEAVGVGARWEVSSRYELNGMSLQQTSRFELVELQGERFTCKVTITQTAKPQQLQLPTLPPGTRAELVSMKGSGNGEMDVSLDRLAPTSSANVTTDLKMRIQADGQNLEMETHMTMGMKLAPIAR